MLAEADEPLVLADGTKIDATGKVIKDKPVYTKIPSNTDARDIVIRANKRVADLPALPDKMNGLSVILVYSMFGLVDTEIAIATGLSIEQIKQIRLHDAYIGMQETLTQNIIKADSDRIRSVIQQHTDTAINKVVDLMVNSDDDKTALKASQDLLDRAGHRPADIVLHQHKMEGTLRIIHVEKKSTSNIPTIDAFGNKVKDIQYDDQ